MAEPDIDPQHWRDCAWMARAKAERVKDDRFKRIMLSIAEVYEGLAERVEQHLRDSENQNPSPAQPIRLSCPPRLSMRYAMATRTNLLDSYRVWVLCAPAPREACP